MAKSSGGKSSGKAAPMTGKSAARVQSAAARNPSSATAASGFAPRAQSAAARNAAAGQVARATQLAAWQRPAGGHQLSCSQVVSGSTWRASSIASCSTRPIVTRASSKR